MILKNEQESMVPNTPMAFNLSLIVPDKEVKNIKIALEAHNLLDRRVKISPAAPKASSEQRTNFVTISPPCHTPHSLWGRDPKRESTGLLRESSSHLRCHESTTWFSIPTVFEVDDTDSVISHAEVTKARDTVLERIGIVDQSCIGASVGSCRRPDVNEQNPLVLAIRESLDLLKLKGVAESAIPSFTLDKCRWTYTVYPPMLLLPSTFFSKESSHQLLAGPLEPNLPEIWHIICRKLNVTHIAISKPIPAKAPNASAALEGDASEPNILRSPTDLTPVYGEFGEANLPPTEENFQRAFWVSTVQNHIVQVWSPLYTMFSRGNIGEKTRLLKLLSPASASGAKPLLRESSGSSAVDLYAGIGYFAFSYVKAGLDKVLCWELNGWSIEGLKRGAKKNGWTTKVVLEDGQERDPLSNNGQDDAESGNEHLLIFNESNCNAAKRVERLRSRIPPVRHVNCGYLPSSSGSWDVAVQVLDPLQGGWIHAHENVGLQDVDRRKSEVVAIFRDLVCQCHKADSEAYRFHVECQHVERVKTYAPGVTHVVFDIAILPDRLR
ncbi:MAG: hypothetical protein L6R38_001150 [Xanthoria sp. 2 TBL-2021]|nr:MAG: hypothetical protein L6R38_001150 [Xanthoria sp. 2 TBL-2021]